MSTKPKRIQQYLPDPPPWLRWPDEVELSPPPPLPPEELVYVSPEELKLDVPPDLDLIDSDGVPMDTIWHFAQMSFLIEVINWRFRERDDFFVGGNTFVYFTLESIKQPKFRGPDFFYVAGVPRAPMRRYWSVRDEGKYPDVILELLSPTTKHTDLTIKKDLYEKAFRTPEYFCYDPDAERLIGWRLVDDAYVPIEPGPGDRLQSEVLGLWIGKWRGVYQRLDRLWIRFFDDLGQPVLIGTEDETRRAEAEKQRAEAEKQRAEIEKQRAEAEKQRADTLATELARLKRQLGGGHANGPST